MDLQLVIVSAIAFAAALYVLRAFRRQWDRPDDEASGCTNCPANPSSARAAAARREKAPAPRGLGQREPFERAARE